MINKAVQLKQELDTFRPISAEMEQRIMQKFRLDWNYHSNNLEGNSLTYGETKALILFGITANGKPLKDHAEVIGHDEAIKWILEIIKENRPLNETFIRELHELILKNPYEVKAITPDGNPTTKRIEIGAYKTGPNHVKTKTGEIFYFATPEETPAKMADLIQWFRQESDVEHVNPIILAAEFHYKFIRIHPFDDGNGRTARILMNFILMQFNYPPVIIKTEDKENYFAALRQADAGIFEPFANYIAENLIHSLEIMIKGAKGESIEEPDDIDKEIALLKASLSEEEIEKNETNVKMIIEKVGIPLFQLMENKLNQINEIFISNKSFLVLRFSNSEYFQLESPINWEAVKNEWLNNNDLKFILSNDFGFECEFSGLKAKKSFNQAISIGITFFDNYYLISTFPLNKLNNNFISPSYYYGDTNIDFNKTVSAFIKPLIKEIKEASKP